MGTAPCGLRKRDGAERLGKRDDHSPTRDSLLVQETFCLVTPGAQDAERMKGTGPQRNSWERTLEEGTRVSHQIHRRWPRGPPSYCALARGPARAAVAGLLTCKEALDHPAAGPHTSSLPLIPATANWSLLLRSHQSGCFIQVESYNTQPLRLASYP